MLKQEVQLGLTADAHSSGMTSSLSEDEII
jgi:hypothetical protein